MSSFLVGTVMTHENVLLFIFRHDVYILLFRLFCTASLNFKFSAFIGFANRSSFNSCESISSFLSSFLPLILHQILHKKKIDLSLVYLRLHNYTLSLTASNQ